MNEIRTILRLERSTLLADALGLLAMASLLVATLHRMPAL